MPLLPAPWKQSFLSHIQTLPCPTFSLATTSSSANGVITPHVRTLVYRGFYAELPHNKHNPVSGNSGWTSNLIAFTTDKRMDKFKDLGGKEGLEAYSSSTSSAANVEACFWIPSGDNPLSGKQWRIRGKCVILPRDMSADSVRTKEWLAGKLGKKDDTGDGDAEFDFAKEYKAHFGNLSPLLRGSFRNPLPGAPKEIGNQGLKPSEKIGDDNLDEKVALDNFRVVVIEPQRVECLNLEDLGRFLWVPVGSDAEKLEELEKFGKVDGDWREVELWP